MKKFLALLMAMAMVFALAACGKDSAENESSDVSTTTSDTATNESTDNNESSTTSSEAQSDETESFKDSNTTSSTPSTSTSKPTTSNEPEYVTSSVDCIVPLDNDIYMSYHIGFQKTGKCYVLAYAFKAVNRKTISQSDIDKINQSLSGVKNYEYYDEEGAFAWSWNSMGAGQGSGNPNEPTTFEQLYTNDSMVKDTYIYGDMCIIPTFILDIEPKFLTNTTYSYTYNSATKTATIGGNSPIQSVVIDGGNTKILIGNKTYKPNSSFTKYMQNQ